MKDLSTLIRLHRWQLEEKRRKLADLERLRADLLRQEAALEAEVAAEQRVAGDAREFGYAYGAYARVAIDRRRHIAQSLDEVARSLTLAQDEVAEGFRTVKSYELAQARAAERERLVLARREQALLDEVGIQQHSRQGGQAV